MTTGRLPTTTTKGLIYALNCIGDSQTQVGPSFGVFPEEMWVERLADKLRNSGALIKGRSYGVGGQTTADFLGRVDLLFQREIPTIGIVYGGVNDPAIQALPSLTASNSGGSINISAGTTYIGVGFVLNLNGGGRQALPLTSVQLLAGSANSIIVGTFTPASNVTGVDIYVTSQAYTTAAAASASNKIMYSSSTGNTGAGATITALPATSAAGMPSVSTQANIQALIKAIKYGVVGNGAGLGTNNWVANQSSLPAYATLGTRIIVMDDNSTTGGKAAHTNSTEHTTITGDYSALGAAQQTVWERRTVEAGEAGWGRVAVTGTAVFNQGCSRIVVVSTNYLNFPSSAGDNVNVSTNKAYTESTSTDAAGTGTYYTSYQAVRVQQLAAATAESVTYCDLFSYMSNLIHIGETTQGLGNWHYVSNNQHHNAYGHDVVARAIFNTIQTTTTWIADLS